MEYVYATLTLTETGAEIDERNLTAVLEAAGAEVVESRVKAIVAALEDLDLAAIGAEAGVEPALAAAAAPPDVAEVPAADDESTDAADESTDADDEPVDADDEPTDAGDDTPPVASDGGREDEDR